MCMFSYTFCTTYINPAYADKGRFYIKHMFFIYVRPILEMWGIKWGKLLVHILLRCCPPGRPILIFLFF